MQREVVGSERACVIIVVVIIIFVFFPSHVARDLRVFVPEGSIVTSLASCLRKGSPTHAALLSRCKQTGTISTAARQSSLTKAPVVRE